MSDLQLSLLVIGAVVIIAVLLYNHLQQRRLRDKLTRAFGDGPADALMGEGNPRREPTVDSTLSRAVENLTDVPPASSAAAAVPAPFAAASAVAGKGRAEGPPADIDEQIDCVATLSGTEPLSAAQVAEILSGVAACGRSWRALGYNTAAGRWEEVNRAVTGHYTRLKLALLMVNRGGPVSAVQLSAFADALNTLATRFGVSLVLPDADKVLAQAKVLDEFCLDVDVAIGINVMAGAEGFSGARVRALLESESFRLEPDGIFHLEDAQGGTLLTVSNRDAELPFLPETVSTIAAQGVTILLDVPRVADADAALQRMFELGRILSVTLKGRLVDDNNAMLTVASMDKIREQITGVHARMNERGVVPGSTRALRLFA